MIHFTLPIIGVPKQADRQRVVVPKKGKPYAHHYQPKEVQESQRNLAALMAPHVPVEPLKGPVSLSLLFRYPWRVGASARHRRRGSQWKDTRPDLENLSKNICDVMQACGFYGNDGQIAKLEIRKLWSSQGGIDVELAALAESEAGDE